jgi:hypothetical protein
METVFEYEHNSRFVFSESSQESLMNEIDDEEFSHSPIKDRIIIQDFESCFIDSTSTSLTGFLEKFICFARSAGCIEEDKIKLLYGELVSFIRVQPRLPGTHRQFIETEPISFHVDQSRQEILDLVSNKAAQNEMALLSLYAYRQMDRINWQPFIKAAFERNPVSLNGMKGRSVDQVYDQIASLPNESIYDGKRLAQPDEVWNFGRGDGVEKAVMLASFLFNEIKPATLNLSVDRSKVILESTGVEYPFVSTKDLAQQINLIHQVRFQAAF